MARARIVPDQTAELVRAVNSVTLRPDDGDIAENGLPAHDSKPAQLDGRYVTFKSKGVGAEVAVSHSLGRVPAGFFEIAREYPSALVGMPNQPTLHRAWTSKKVYFVTQAPEGSAYTVLLL